MYEMSQQMSEDVHRTEVDRESKRRLDRRLLIWAAVAAVAALVLIGAFVVSESRESAPAAEEVATSFVEAVGTFDAEQAISYLADDADISQMISSVGGHGVEGTPEEFRLLLSLLDASGYEQTLSSCEELGGSASGTSVSCTFDFHNFGSDEIGRGPFSGSSFFLTVRDGAIVQARMEFETGEFSPQMWEPFAGWVSKAYPEDAAVMYEDATYTGVRLTEESIGLWERHTRGYVEEVGTGVSVTKPRVPKVDYVIDLNTGVMTPLPKAIIRSLGKPSERGLYPAWASRYAASSDGSRLAYVGIGDEGSPQIFIAGIDGTGVRQVTHDPLRAASPAWSPDGTMIAYKGSGGVFVLDLPTGESTPIADLGGVDPFSKPQFTPDGSSLLYTSGTGRAGDSVLRTVPIDGGKSTVLIGPDEGMGHAGNGSLSPDGSLVTMMGHEIGGPGALRFVANADGTDRRVIPGRSSNPAGTWSPDGGRIVCSDDGGKHIVVVDVATGVASRVARGKAAIWLDRNTLLVEVW